MSCICELHTTSVAKKKQPSSLVRSLIRIRGSDEERDHMVRYQLRKLSLAASRCSKMPDNLVAMTKILNINRPFDIRQERCDRGLPNSTRY